MKRPTMLRQALLLLIALSAAPAAQLATVADTDQRPRVVMDRYLAALSRMDHQGTSRYWAPSLGMDLDVARGYREFERATATVWRFRIVQVRESVVRVQLREANTFYDLLGVGERTMLVDYTVQQGQIVAMKTISMKHGRGDYGERYDKFAAWLRKRYDGRTTPLLRPTGSVRFDGQTAGALLDEVREWQKQ